MRRLVLASTALALAGALPCARVHAQAAGERRAALACEPAQAEIGQPLECTLTLRHPRGTTARLAVKDDALAPDDSWVQLEDARRLTADAEGGRVSTWTWTLCSLDPGARELAAPELLLDGLAEQDRVAPATARVQVASALADGEDAPRPATGFRAPPEHVAPAWKLVPWLGGAALVALLALAALFVRLVRRRPAPGAPAADPFELLLAEARDPAAGPERLRALHFELSRELRAAVDARLGVARAGATDEEWLRVVRAGGGLSAAEGARLAELLHGCERIKYAAQQPTRWAAEANVEAARELSRAAPEGGQEAAA